MKRRCATWRRRLPIGCALAAARAFRKRRAAIPRNRPARWPGIALRWRRAPGEAPQAGAPLSISLRQSWHASLSFLVRGSAAAPTNGKDARRQPARSVMDALGARTAPRSGSAASRVPLAASVYANARSARTLPRSAMPTSAVREAGFRHGPVLGPQIAWRSGTATASDPARIAANVCARAPAPASARSTSVTSAIEWPRQMTSRSPVAPRMALAARGRLARDTGRDAEQRPVTHERGRSSFEAGPRARALPAPLPLAWRKAPSTPEAGEMPSERGQASATVTSIRSRAEPAPQRQEATLAAVEPKVKAAARAAALDPALVDRLADDIVRRVERRVRIERERRGI